MTTIITLGFKTGTIELERDKEIRSLTMRHRDAGRGYNACYSWTEYQLGVKYLVCLNEIIDYINKHFPEEKFNTDIINNSIQVLMMD